MVLVLACVVSFVLCACACMRVLLLEFNHVIHVNIGEKRTRGLASKFKLAKCTFSVYQQRSFLLRDCLIGEGEFRLKDLVERCEVDERVKVGVNDMAAPCPYSMACVRAPFFFWL